MKIKCDKCNSIYNVDESKIPQKRVFVKCKKCQNIILILVKKDNKGKSGKAKSCPKCGAKRKGTELECSACGVIFAKLDQLIELEKNRKEGERKKQLTDEARKKRKEEKRKEQLNSAKKNITNKIAQIIDIKGTIKKTSLVKKIILSLICIVLTVYALNYYSLQRNMNNVLSSDPRNKGVDVRVHYGSYLNTGKLIYDLAHVGGNNSKVDIFRIFLQFSEVMQKKQFDYVILSCNGNKVFYLKGDYFNKLGREFPTQNPIYTIRTFPEHLYLPNGERAFSTWTGGLLGVMGKQMEDFNTFHEQWYLTGLRK